MMTKLRVLVHSEAGAVAVLPSGPCSLMSHSTCSRTFSGVTHFPLHAVPAVLDDILSTQSQSSTDI